MDSNLDASSHGKKAQEQGEKCNASEEGQRGETDQLKKWLQDSKHYSETLTGERDELHKRLQEAERHIKEWKNRASQEINSLKQFLEEEMYKNVSLENQIISLHSENDELKKQIVEDWRIQRKDLVMDKRDERNLLGKGSFGAVYKGTFCGYPVAVKELHTQETLKHNRRLFEREIMVAAKCHHPNLVRLMGFVSEQRCLLIVMELLECNLRHFISNFVVQQGQGRPGKYLAVGIAQGLCYLHKKNPPIVHRDIKSENILLKIEMGSWMAKIGDYGTANVVSKLMTPNRGTLEYAAPEAKTDDDQSPKMDVYSFGKVLLEMATCQRPDEGPCYDLIKTLEHSGLKELIVRCTAFDPRERPTMEEVLVALNHLQ